VWRLIDCFEWAIKWCTSVTVAELMRSRDMTDTMRAALAEGLRVPSLGLWVHFHRMALEQPGSPTLWRDWDRVLPLEVAHKIVRFRNTYAHGALKPEDACWEDVSTYRPVLDELLASPFFSLVTSVPPDPDVDNQVQPALVRVEGLAEPLLDLSPIALWQRRADVWRWYFFNALRNPKVESLNYDIPETDRSKALWEPFHSRLPLHEWRRLEADSAFLDEIHALTESFKGRQAERDALGSFMATGGTLFLLGSPGIGKSALLAMSVLDAKRLDPHERPVLIEHFIRRGSVTASAAYFLSSLVKRIERAYKLQREAEPTSEAEWFDRLLEVIHAIRVRYDAPPLVLLIDGLDEAPDLIGYLVPGDERVRVLASSRPTAEVMAQLNDVWIPLGARQISLGPLEPSDVRALLFEAANKYDDRFTDDYVHGLTRISEGNPLFLYLFLQQLIDEPDLLGRLDRIPRGIAPLLDEAIKRATSGDDETALDVLYALAVSFEALTARDISQILGQRERFITARIDKCREIVVEGDDDPPSYQLFHEVLREHLVRPDRFGSAFADDAVDLHIRVAQAALEASPEQSRYLAKWGPDHALAAGERTLIDGFAHRLQEPTFADARVDLLDPETLLRQYIGTYAAIDDELRDALADALGQTIARAAVSGSPSLVPEVIHGVLGYHPDVRLYDHVITHLVEQATDPASSLTSGQRAGFLHCAGTRSRRKGGVENFGEAQRLLELGLEMSMEGGDSPMLSRLYYDLGYVAMLGGDAPRAREWFESSAQAAREQGNEVAAAIADCVLAVFLSRIEAVTPARAAEILGAAFSVFEAHADRSVNAERWVSNVHAHLLDLHCEMGDENQARFHAACLADDPWVRRFSAPIDTDAWLALVDLTFGDPGVALAPLEARAAPEVDILEPLEQRARWFLSWGDALARVGRVGEARDSWSMGLNCPLDAGNWMWRPVLAARLDGRGGGRSPTS